MEFKPAQEQNGLQITTIEFARWNRFENSNNYMVIARSCK